MSGSIAAFKACEVISDLVKEGAEVQVATTDSTVNFIGDATLEGLTGRQVLRDLWAGGRAMDHIQLTRWADVAVLCPASANTVAKIALGLADDLVTSLALAWPHAKPFHVFPAMNTTMLQSPATQRNLRTLQDHGFQVAPTAAGDLACGEVGEGRLLEPSTILQTILQPALPRRGTLIVTAGATREPIDGVRFISNVSSGQTGAELTDQLRRRGWSVLHLHGQGAKLPTTPGPTVSFSTARDLEHKLREHLGSGRVHGVIHAAAVSDYTVAQPRTDVKFSSQDDLELQLVKNPKILGQIKGFSPRSLKVVGFKLTLNARPEDTIDQARGLLTGAVDAVIANDWSEVERDRRQHPCWFVTGGTSPQRWNDLLSLAVHIDRWLTADLSEEVQYGAHP